MEVKLQIIGNIDSEIFLFFKVSPLKGHSRSPISVPTESQCATFY